jgi:uncharacterized membrane protein
MEILKYIAVFIVALITILILDYIWLWYVTKDFIIRSFSGMITLENGNIKINMLAWILAWCCVAWIVVTFVTFRYDSYLQIAFYGALIWFLSYAIYDFTNLAFLNNYSLWFTFADIAWGTFTCMTVALSSYSFWLFIK